MNAPVFIEPVPERLRLRVEDFILLCDAGALDDHGKSELIDGEIFVMNSQWSRHARIKTELTVELALWARAAGAGLRAISEVSIRASDHDMPEPDIVLTSWRGDRDVPVATVALVVEVADTTLDRDLGRKLAVYARAGVPEYWVVDVGGGRMLLFAQPVGDGFARRREATLGEVIEAATIEGLRIDTAGLTG